MKAPFWFVESGSKFRLLERGEDTGVVYTSFEKAKADVTDRNNDWRAQQAPRAKRTKKRNPEGAVVPGRDQPVKTPGFYLYQAPKGWLLFTTRPEVKLGANADIWRTWEGGSWGNEIIQIWYGSAAESLLDSINGAKSRGELQEFEIYKVSPHYEVTKVTESDLAATAADPDEETWSYSKRAKFKLPELPKSVYANAQVDQSTYRRFEESERALEALKAERKSARDSARAR